MPKADVLALAALIGAEMGDAATLSHYYDEEVRRIALERGWLCDATIVEPTAGTHTYEIPTAAVRALGLFYDDHEVTMESHLTLEAAVGADWRARTGPPHSYVVEDVEGRQFRLVPTPTEDGQAWVPVFVEPLGRDYPARCVVVAHTTAPQDVPNWLELPIALRILAREFERPSDHRDTEFAVLCAALSEALYNMLG